MATVEELVQELVGMSLKWRVGEFDENRAVFLHPENKPRVFEIGNALFQLGGISVMRSAAEQVKASVKVPGDVPELNYAWDGIGTWLA
jgi:hypothetical protein